MLHLVEQPEQTPMDLNEIRKFIEEDGGKFIILENGKPVMVITSFEDYKKRVKIVKRNNSNTEPIVQTQEEKSMPRELEEEPLKIEDLPFES